jgi:lipase
MDLALERRSNGPSKLLLIHGLGASRDHLYATADALDGHAACLLVDLRGHGESPGGADGTVAGYAADLVDLVRQEAPLGIAGLSFGGAVGVAAWQAVPAAVSSLFVVEPALDVESLWTWAHTRARTRRDAYRELISPFLEEDEDKLVRLMASHPLTHDLGPDERRRNARSHVRADRRSLDATLRAMRADGAPVTMRRPAGTSAAVTVVRGTRSQVCPPTAAAAFAAELGGRVVEIDAGHCVSLSAPHRLAELLADLLTCQPPVAAQRSVSPVQSSA